jgi:hypothetical protein
MNYKRVWVIIVAILIVVVAFFLSDKYPERNAIFGGIAASIVASFIFWFLTDVLQVNSERESFHNAINRLESLEKSRTDGIVSIFKRNDDIMVFWIDFVNSAQDKLTLSGRTLTRWLDGKERQEALTKALERIVKKKVQIAVYDEPVRLVIYSDDGLNDEISHLSEKEVDSLKEGKENFKKYLYNIWKNLSDEEKERLAVYEIDVLPYLYCNNGKYCVTGTYFMHRDDKMNMQLVLRCGDNLYEHEYTGDFLEIIKKSSSKVKDLNNWGTNLSKKSSKIKK